MNSDEMPNTLLEAVVYFADEGRAHDFMVQMRWAGDVTCPHCESENVGTLSVSTRINAKGKPTVRRVWNCKTCKKQFTVKVGTIFEDSPLPLSKWLPAVWMICNAKNGVSSYELHRALGITQKSAWHMGHRIRTAMKEGKFTLSGEIEADETYIGGKAVNKHKNKKDSVTTGPHGESFTPVAGLLQRSAEGHPLK